MDVTAKLLRLYQVEKQLRGLQARLQAAEKFLAEQDKDLGSLSSKRSELEHQIKLLRAQAGDREGEVKRLDERMSTIRKQMDGAQTNKEYQAFLTELNNYKVDRDRLETAALEFMQKVEDLSKTVETVEGQRSERDKVRGVAQTDREARYKEIESRLVELKAQRDQAAAEVPSDVLLMLTRLLNQRGEEAMASVQVEDRKRHEYTCGACQMSIPVDAVSALLSKGKLTLCASCQCILYLDDEAMRALNPPKAGPKAGSKK
ncbi:MAG: hypothetical protein WAZ94_01080 [Phycisphaerales bacterium]